MDESDDTGQKDRVANDELVYGKASGGNFPPYQAFDEFIEQTMVAERVIDSM